jgi:hypothetical protein
VGSVAVQRQRPTAIALTAPKAFHWRAAYPCHCKSVNRIPDNFLPKTRGGLMMEGFGTGEQPGSDCRGKIFDGYPKTIGPPDWARILSGEANR